jgi:hypothetical protein
MDNESVSTAQLCTCNVTNCTCMARTDPNTNDGVCQACIEGEHVAEVGGTFFE